MARVASKSNIPPLFSPEYQVSDADRIILALEALGKRIDAVKDAIYALRIDLRGGARTSRGESYQDAGSER